MCHAATAHCPSRQIKAALPLTNGSEQSLPQHSLVRIRRHLEVVLARHDRRQHGVRLVLARVLEHNCKRRLERSEACSQRVGAKSNGWSKRRLFVDFGQISSSAQERYRDRERDKDRDAHTHTRPHTSTHVHTRPHTSTHNTQEYTHLQQANWESQSKTAQSCACPVYQVQPEAPADAVLAWMSIQTHDQP